MLFYAYSGYVFRWSAWACGENRIVVVYLSPHKSTHHHTGQICRGAAVFFRRTDSLYIKLTASQGRYSESFHTRMQLHHESTLQMQTVDTFLANMEALNTAFAAWVQAQTKRSGVVDMTAACEVRRLSCPRSVVIRLVLMCVLPCHQQYVKFRNDLGSDKVPMAASFTRSSVVPQGDTSFFAKSSAMPFAPKMPSPLGSGETAPAPMPAPKATAAQNDSSVDENGDVVETNPEVRAGNCCENAAWA